jgi:hypothetical protein
VTRAEDILKVEGEGVGSFDGGLIEEGEDCERKEAGGQPRCWNRLGRAGRLTFVVIGVVLLENLDVGLNLAPTPALARSAKEVFGHEPVTTERVSINHDRTASDVGNRLESCHGSQQVSHRAC